MLASFLKTRVMVRPLTRHFVNDRISGMITHKATRTTIPATVMVMREHMNTSQQVNNLTVSKTSTKYICNKQPSIWSNATHRLPGILSSSGFQFQAYSNKPDHTQLSDSAWSCKLALENGYLSWCRNAYIAGVFSVGMLFKSQSDWMDFACYLIFMIPLLNMTWGSLSYIYNLVVMRHRLGMSNFVLGYTMLVAILKMSIFLFAVLLFLSESDPKKMVTRLKSE